MKIDPNFTIAKDKLSRYLKTHDSSLLSDSMLLLKHGSLTLESGFSNPLFFISIYENGNMDQAIAGFESPEETLEETMDEVCRMTLEYQLILARATGVSEEYGEFFRTVRDNDLRLEFLDGKNKSGVLKSLRENFVNGDPRALWLSLRNPAERLGTPDKDPYWRLPEYIAQDRPLFLIIDINNAQYAVYHGLFCDIHAFIADCGCLDEYYLMSGDFRELWCATDHDELLYTRTDHNGDN